MYSHDAFKVYSIELNESKSAGSLTTVAAEIPLMRYRLYQYVIAINHFKNELFICENSIEGIVSEIALVESLIKSKDVPTFPFKTKGEESSNLTDDNYFNMVKLPVVIGDVFRLC
jgi:anthranilate synthase component 1